MFTLPKTPYIEFNYDGNDLMMYATPYESQTALALVVIEKETTERYGILTLNSGEFVAKDFILLNASEHEDLIEMLASSGILEIGDKLEVDGQKVWTGYILEGSLLESVVTTDFIDVTMTHTDDRWGTEEGLLSMFAAPLDEKRGRIISLLGIDSDKEPSMVDNIGEEIIRDPKMTISFQFGMYGKTASQTEKRLKKLQSKTLQLVIGEKVKTLVNVDNTVVEG